MPIVNDMNTATMRLWFTCDIWQLKHGVRHHLYADDKQAYLDVYVQDIDKARSTLQDCIADVRSWCSSRRLQLNTDKTELIWFGSKQTLDKVSRSDLTLQLDSGTLNPVEVVRNLGVLLDAELSMKQHVTWIASNCFYQLRRLRQIRSVVSKEVTSQLISIDIDIRVCAVATRLL